MHAGHLGQTALNPARFLQPINVTAEGNRFDIHDIGHGRLVYAFVASEHGDDPPLRPSHAEGASQPIKTLTQQS